VDDDGRGKVGGLNGQALETEPPRGRLQAAAAPVAGQPAHVIVFQGEVNDAHVAGECLAFHHQGIGYWLYMWKRGTVDQRDDPEFPGLRNRITLLGERQKWKDLEKRRQYFSG